MRNLAFVLLLFLPSCASITNGSTQSIAVDTNPQKASECQLSNEKGTWHVIRTPASTTVTKANGPLTVSCAAIGGYKGSTSIQSTTAGATFGNILVGGIIGAAVDMSSGAAYNYPAQVIVPLVKGDDTLQPETFRPPMPPQPQPVGEKKPEEKPLYPSKRRRL